MASGFVFFYGTPMCVNVSHCICMCVLCFSFGSVSCLVLLSYSDFFVSDLSYCISDARFFLTKRKGVDLDWQRSCQEKRGGGGGKE